MINFKKVNNILYRGGKPEKRDIPYLKQKYGIQQIISLDKNIADYLHKTILENGIRHVVIPLDFSNSNVDKLKNVSKLIGSYRTFVHCKMGKDRTGLFVAKYRTENGWDCIRAIKEALSFGFGIGVDNDILFEYIEAITNSCQKDHDHFSLGNQMSKKSTDNFITTRILRNANALFLDEVIEEEETAVTESKEQPSAIENDGTSNNSNLIHIENSGVEGGTLLSHLWSASSLEFKKKILIATQQQSFSIPPHLKQNAQQCLEEFQKLIYGKIDDKNTMEGDEYRSLLEHMDVLYIPFKENSGVKSEHAKLADKHFIVFDKVMKNKMLKFKQRALKCIDLLDEFKTDKDISSILDEFVKQISTLQDNQDSLSLILEDFENNDFQPNVIKAIDIIKKQMSQIKYFVEQRVVQHIKKEILNVDWVSELKEQIIDDKKEEKYSQDE